MRTVLKRPLDLISAVVLMSLLSAPAGAALRRAYRANRRRGFRYQRKMGTLLHDRRHPMAATFMEMARTAGFRRLIKKWRGFYD